MYCLPVFKKIYLILNVNLRSLSFIMALSLAALPKTESKNNWVLSTTLGKKKVLIHLFIHLSALSLIHSAICLSIQSINLRIHSFNQSLHAYQLQQRAEQCRKEQKMP